MATPAPMTVVTIGYQGRQLDELIAELSGRGVALVFDVRENAISRKPGFSKRRLGEALAVAGIGYRHVPALGNPRRNRDAFRAGEPAAREVFKRRIAVGSPAALDEIAGVAATTTVALLCFERDHASCHRSGIAELLVARQPDLRIEAV